KTEHNDEHASDRQGGRMTTALVVAASLVVALIAHRLVIRRSLRRIEGLAEDLAPSLGGQATRGLASAIDQLERAVANVAADRAGHHLAQQRLVRGFDAIPQGVVIADGEGATVFHNEAGSLFSAARHGDALVEAAIRALTKRAIGGETCVETVELFGPPKRTLVITAVPFDPDTVGPGAVAVIDDVTDRRRLEAVRRDF